MSPKVWHQIAGCIFMAMGVVWAFDGLLALNGTSVMLGAVAFAIGSHHMDHAQQEGEQ